MLKPDYNTLRIRLICKFLDAGGGTLEEMLSFVNRKLESLQASSISLRTLQTCIENLRKGKFNHNLEPGAAAKRKNVFRVGVINRNTYQWESGTLKPQFGDLDEGERYTLPFIFAMLRKYEHIPAIQKIKDELPVLLGVSDEDTEGSAFIVHQGAVLYDGLNKKKDFYKNVIELVIQLLGHIHRREKIQFHYQKVDKLEDTVKALVHHVISPLQIRFYDEMYYLVGVDEKYKRMLNFRVDLIHQLKVEFANDDDESVVYVDAETLRKTYKPEDFSKYTIGVWNFPETASVYEIHIQFSEWASAHILRMKYHQSQKVISKDVQKNTCVISFKLKLYPERFAGQAIVERNLELAFLLGRYREFAKVLKADLI